MPATPKGTVNPVVTLPENEIEGSWWGLGYLGSQLGG